MSYFIRIITIITFIAIPAFLRSQSKIDISIKDHNDSVYYLLKYKSDKSYIVIDTSNISNKKKTFENNNNYEEGIYVIADSKVQPLFEILLGKDQKFSINIKELMDYKTYKAKKSFETEKYFEVYSRTIHDELYIKALKNEIKAKPDNKFIIDSISKQLAEYQESIINIDTNSFLSTYVRCIKNIVIPDEIKDYKSKSNAYIIEHYFDDIPLYDIRILNSRLLKNKLDDYFNNYIYTKDADEICANIDKIITKTYNCQDVRDYILWYLYSKYFNPENIKHEKVYIYLIDNYFSKMDIDNLSDDIREQMIERANVLREILIGNHAPNISFYDENNNHISIDSIFDANIVLFFYKPDCQKCIKDKRIVGLIEKRRDDLKVLSIDISDETKYEDIINKYDISTTPTIFILDKNKKIIAKNVKAEEIEFYLIKNHRNE